MRKFLFIATAALLSGIAAQAQTSSASTPAPNEGLGCFVNLAAPEYPKAALQAHVDGSVWTTAHVSGQGSVEKVDTEVVSAWSKGPELLVPAVEKAVRSAKIKPECAGKTVSVVFRYQLYGEPTANPKVTTKTDAPNLFWIESQPLSTAPVETSSKARQ
jgi:hypothetical protein